MEEGRPIAAFIVSLVAGLLMFVEGVILSAAASIASSAGFFGAGSLLGGLGFIGGLFGFLVVVLAIQLYRNPDAHTGYSVAILVVSILSIFGGGGFFLGLVLGIIGAILGFLFVPEEPMLPWEEDELSSRPATSPGKGKCWSCETPVPPGATKCANCGVSLTGA